MGKKYLALWLKLAEATLLLAVTNFILTGCSNDQKETQPAPTSTAFVLTKTPQVTLNSSITTTTPSLTTQANDKYDWQTNWLQGQPCEPPCFEGITPGVTTPDQAVSLLRKNPLINEVSKSDRDDGSGEVGWLWKDAAKQADPSLGNGGTAFYETDPKHNTIFWIVPLFGKLNFTFKEVISKYGQPSNILVLSDL